jgi:2-alkyl-3-oxoalkanoate reductase
MRLLVTGANGFLGSHIAETLAAAGHDVRLLVRKTSRLDSLSGLDVEQVQGDVREPGSLLRAAKGMDVVVHAAGVTSALSGRDYDNVNARGTNAMISAAVLADVRRFVYVSSLAAQGPSPDGQVQQPDVEPHPTSPYGRSKLAAERYVLRAVDDMSVAIVRPPVIYGPRDRGVLPLFRLAKYRLVPLYADGKNRLSWVYVTDAAEAIAAVAAAEGPAGSIYTISDGQIYTWHELVDKAQVAIGYRPIRIQVPHTLYATAGRAADVASLVVRRPLPLNSHKVVEMSQKNWICDNQRISEEIGWGPKVGAQEGVSQTIRWYRENRWL